MCFSRGPNSFQYASEKDLIFFLYLKASSEYFASVKLENTSAVNNNSNNNNKKQQQQQQQQQQQW